MPITQCSPPASAAPASTRVTQRNADAVDAIERKSLPAQVTAPGGPVRKVGANQRLQHIAGRVEAGRLPLPIGIRIQRRTSGSSMLHDFGADVASDEVKISRAARTAGGLAEMRARLFKPAPRSPTVEGSRRRTIAPSPVTFINQRRGRRFLPLSLPAS